MNSTPSLRRAVLVLLALVTVLASAGCVNLPANTDVKVVGNPAKGGTGADVRIWPQAPRRGEKPDQIVEGFIQTAASDPSNLPIAQDYLTGEAQSNWHPNRVAVFSDLSSPSLAIEQNDPGHVKVQITGTIVAKVSDNGAYQQVQEPTKDASYVFTLTLDPTKGYYQIERLPSPDFGILLTQEAFRANYAAYYLYYLDQSTPTPSMIPVTDYQRSQAGDAATAQNLVTALRSGLPDALDGIADLAAPNINFVGSVTISPDNIASVPIKTPSNCADSGRRTCGLLADELLATFSSLASINRVELVDPQGKLLVFSSTVDTLVDRYNIGANPAKSTSFYYLDSKSAQVNRYEIATSGSNSTNIDQVGPDTRKYSQLAVGSAPSQPTFAAAVDDKGNKLYVGTPGSSKESDPVYTAATGHHVSSPTWDAFGHLWFLDTAGADVSLYRLDMTAQPKPMLQQVATAGDGGTIDGIAVAPDGRRIAVSYTDARAAGSPVTYSVVIATVADTPSGLEANLSFGIEQPVVDHWTSVVDVSWHGSQALAVLGSASSSSPPTISELNSDGSPVINAADLSPVTYNPPTGTTGIVWTGSALLAATHSGNANAPELQIEQYSFTTGTWTVDANGLSPTYVN